MNNKMNTKDLEVTVAQYLNYRQNIIVPNISWGLRVHECDLFMLSKTGYATEVEIKISKADLIKDFQKRHSHSSNKIRRFFYAMPEEIYNKLDQEVINSMPNKAGIIVVYMDKYFFRRCRIVRKALINNNARKLSDKEIQKLLHLGVMRTWDLRKAVRALTEQNKALRGL